METTTMVFLVVMGWFTLSATVSFYNMFHAPRCPADAKAGGCLRPLFAGGEPIDMHVYLTTDPKLRWWTQAGLEELRRAPLWNATGLRFGEPAEAVSAVLPLSLPQLAAVRANESALHAHVFLSRANSSLEDALRSSRGRPERRAGTAVVSADLLHSSAALTKLMPQMQKRRRSLLEDAEANASSAAAGDEAQPVFVELPGSGVRLPVYPGDALMWAGSSFTATSFLTPSLPFAAVRGGLAAIVAPWLLQLRSQQAEQRRAERRQQRALESRLWQQNPAPITPHLAPLVRIALSVDDQAYDARLPPPLLFKEMVFEGVSPMPTAEREIRYAVVGGGTKRYVPPLSIDQFGMVQRSWRPLDSNASKEDPSIPVEVDVSGMIKYSIVQTMRETLQMYIRMGFTERDLEDMKDFFFRYPVHILILMQVIGVVQMALTTMAFKTDISFFRGRSDYTGLSSRSLATDTLQEIIIFLYLYDYDDISRIVLFQVGVSSIISAWKYARVARLQLRWRYLLPWVAPSRGVGASEEEKNTEDIDARGMYYLKCLLYPLSACWGLYNLYHNAYKSWWSWLVSSLADFAYTFGFINMMPQIFINYKLKSVAHMPWKVLMYKFFNTFIDDVFAFFIMSDYMTKKHRFMTLRDDIVFFIFLFQRHIYKVDPSRPDEFGFVYADAAKTGGEGKAALPADAATDVPADGATDAVADGAVDGAADGALAPAAPDRPSGAPGESAATGKKEEKEGARRRRPREEEPSNAAGAEGAVWPKEEE